jgi:SAM-dependent methyltransferase
MSTEPTGDAATWLAEAQRLLAADQRTEAAALLRRTMQQPAMRLAAHNVIEAHRLPGCFTDMMGLECRIAPADDIFHFFAGHPTSTNPLRDYLADGWRTLSELLVLLDSVDRPLSRMHDVLEFASGLGRFTRHLVKAIGAQRLTVSDIVQDAVDFSAQTFGVRGFVSSTEPQAVQWPQRYELVFVLSLFSHLPERTWGPWLRRLYEALAPGGLLVFSTHGPVAAGREGVTLDARGFFFAPSSESSAIAAQDYGTTFTSAAFVQAQIEEHLGSADLVQHAPLQFWNHQDGWIVRRP